MQQLRVYIYKIKKNKIENSTGNEEDGWGNLDK